MFVTTPRNYFLLYFSHYLPSVSQLQLANIQVIVETIHPTYITHHSIAQDLNLSGSYQGKPRISTLTALSLNNWLYILEILEVEALNEWVNVKAFLIIA